MEANGAHFKHDCATCQFLGHKSGFDIYACPQTVLGTPTVVARYGDEGPEYHSGAPFFMPSYAHQEPWVRAAASIIMLTFLTERFPTVEAVKNDR